MLTVLAIFDFYAARFPYFIVYLRTTDMFMMMMMMMMAIVDIFCYYRYCSKMFNFRWHLFSTPYTGIDYSEIRSHVAVTNVSLCCKCHFVIVETCIILLNFITSGIVGTGGGGNYLQKFWAVGKLGKKFWSKNAKFWAENSYVGEI